ncbi:hypothetical protein [Nocardia terpenica]|uniref:Scaffolding protein n=1 Tax=Nocardia terpenica TaxID=455432 RepID=A0A6G9YYZ1_9NOCA|nr:hypothetical protein [Nocardia terpenica]QIS18535.1 hypothetical protein F6W96_09780 [Nocardia terpenica]
MSTAQPTTEPTTAPEADVDNDTTPDTPDAPQSGEPASGNVDAPKGGEDASSEPKGSQAEDPRLRSARNDAAKYRTRASKAETDLDAFKQQVGKLFGFVSDDETTDPKKLTTQLESAVKDANEARIELAVYRAAGKDVDADALLDSRAFSAAISKLDFTADDFAAQVAAEITKATEKNPKYRLNPVAEPPKPPKRSGADTGSGKGENSGQLTYAQYQALSPSERVKAVKEGRANQILGRK